MSNELLLLIKKHTDTLIEGTKAQEKLEFRMVKPMETSFFSPPINFSDEGKRLLAVTSFEAIKSVLNITNENNRFSKTSPSYCISDGSSETLIKLRDLLELREQDDIVLQVEKFRKRGNLRKIRDKEYILSHLDTHKNEEIDLYKNAV